MAGSETTEDETFTVLSGCLDMEVGQKGNQCHAAASKALALIYGRIMPFWYALTLVLTIGVAFILRLNQPSFFLLRSQQFYGLY